MNGHLFNCPCDSCERAQDAFQAACDHHLSLILDMKVRELTDLCTVQEDIWKILETLAERMAMLNP